MNERGVSEWCAGQRLCLERPLEPEERRQLAAMIGQLRGRIAPIVLAGPALLAALVLGAMRFDPESPIVQGILAAGAILLFGVLLPLQVLLIRDRLRRARALRRDLNRGIVKRYSGLADPILEHDPVRQRLVRAGVIPAEPGEDVWFEVLAASGRVWQGPAGRTRCWIEVPSTVVADLPESAAIAAEWLDEVESHAGYTVSSGRRGLSGRELEEIREVARQQWRRPLPAAILLTLWLMVPLSLILISGRLGNRASTIQFGVLAVVTVVTDVFFIRGLLAARRLGQDIELGWVVIFRRDELEMVEVEDEREEDEEADEREEDEEADEREEVGETTGRAPAEPETAEVLPVSKWIWSSNGRPAAWRRIAP